MSCCRGSKQLGTNDSFSFLFLTRKRSRDGRHADAAPLSTTAHHVICFGHGGASEDRAVNGRSLEEVQKRGGWNSINSVRRYEKHVVSRYVEDLIRTFLERIGTRTQFGTTLEKTLTRALTGSTSRIGRVFLCISNTVRPVGSMSNTHTGYAVLILDPCRGPAFDVGQSAVTSTVLELLAVGRVLGLWSGTPSLASVQRNSQVLQVDRFLRACAALGVPTGEHSPFD